MDPHARPSLPPPAQAWRPPLCAVRRNLVVSCEVAAANSASMRMHHASECADGRPSPVGCVERVPENDVDAQGVALGTHRSARVGERATEHDARRVKGLAQIHRLEVRLTAPELIDEGRLAIVPLQVAVNDISTDQRTVLARAGRVVSRTSHEPPRHHRPSALGACLWRRQTRR